MNTAFPEVETDEEEDETKEEEDEENGDDEDEDDSMDSDDEDDEETVENDSESDSSDPWENLRAKVRDALNPSYVKQVERFLGKGTLELLLRPKRWMFSYRLTEESCNKALRILSKVVSSSQVWSCTSRSHEHPTSLHGRGIYGLWRSCGSSRG